MLHAAAFQVYGRPKVSSSDHHISRHKRIPRMPSSHVSRIVIAGENRKCRLKKPFSKRVRRFKSLRPLGVGPTHAKVAFHFEDQRLGAPALPILGLLSRRQPDKGHPLEGLHTTLGKKQAPIPCRAMRNVL